MKSQSGNIVVVLFLFAALVKGQTCDVLPQCDSEHTKAMINGQSVLGTGYNLLTGNGILNADDKGILNRRMALLHGCGLETYNNVQRFDVLNCRAKAQVEDISSTDAWQESRERSVDMSLGIPEVFKFGASTDMKRHQEQTTKENLKTFSAETSCTVWELTLQTEDNLSYKFCQGFVQSVKNLVNSDDKGFDDFFATWGTHLISTVVVGSKTYSSMQASNYDVEQAKSSGVNIKTSVSAQFEVEGVPVEGEGGTGSSDSDAASSSFKQKLTNSKTITVGSPPDPPSQDVSVWKERARKDGAAVQFKLDNIPTKLYTFMKPYWGATFEAALTAVQDAELKALQNRMQDYYENDYCPSLRSAESDIICSPKKTFDLKLSLSKLQQCSSDSQQVVSCPYDRQKYESFPVNHPDKCSVSSPSANMLCLSKEFDVQRIDVRGSGDTLVSKCGPNYKVIGCQSNTGGSVFVFGSVQKIGSVVDVDQGLCTCHFSIACRAVCLPEDQVSDVRVLTKTEQGNQVLRCESGSYALGYAHYRSALETVQPHGGLSAIDAGFFYNAIWHQSQLICGKLRNVQTEIGSKLETVVRPRVKASFRSRRQTELDEKPVDLSQLAKDIGRAFVLASPVVLGPAFQIAFSEHADGIFVSLHLPIQSVHHARALLLADVSRGFDDGLFDFHGIVIDKANTLAMFEDESSYDVQKTQGTCPSIHPCCVEGGRECANKVVECVGMFDPYCKNTFWDEQCIDEAGRCGVECV